MRVRGCDVVMTTFFTIFLIYYNLMFQRNSRAGVDIVTTAALQLAAPLSHVQGRYGELDDYFGHCLKLFLVFVQIFSQERLLTTS